jgi:hypothetical protein
LPSHRQAAIALAAVLLLGLAALVTAAATKESSLNQTLGVLPVYPIAPLHAHGGTVCEQPIAVAEPIEAVRFNIGTFGRPGPALHVRVERWGGGPLAQGRVAPGWVDDGTPQTVPLRRVAPGQYIRVCIRNDGPIRAYVYGDLGTGTVGTELTSEPRPTVTPASASVDDVELVGDVAMWFVGDESRSLLSRVPDVFERASLFRPAFVGPWVFWVLLLGLVVLAPLALVAALRAALGSAEEPARAREDGRAREPAGATLAPPRVDQQPAASTRGSTD